MSTKYGFLLSNPVITLVDMVIFDVHQMSTRTRSCPPGSLGIGDHREPGSSSREWRSEEKQQRFHGLGTHFHALSLETAQATE